MRRILQKIAAGNAEDLGDISTISDPSVIENLIKKRLSLHVEISALDKELPVKQA